MASASNEAGVVRIFRAVIAWSSNATAIVAASMIFLIMLLMTLEVINRLGGAGSVPGTYGLARLLLVAAVFFAVAYGERIGEHIRVDLLTRSLPKKVEAPLKLFGNLVTLGFVILLAIATAQRAIDSVAVGEYLDGLGNFLVWPSRIVITFGLILLILEMLLRVADDFTRVWNVWRDPSSVDDDSSVTDVAVPESERNNG